MYSTVVLMIGTDVGIESSVVDHFYLNGLERQPSQNIGQNIGRISAIN
jgi:hypothetical protein